MALVLEKDSKGTSFYYRIKKGKKKLRKLVEKDSKGTSCHYRIKKGKKKLRKLVFADGQKQFYQGDVGNERIEKAVLGNGVVIFDRGSNERSSS
eukprot:6455928-Prymnesium_polylepis.1